jgi:hypothetical protein
VPSKDLKSVLVLIYVLFQYSKPHILTTVYLFVSYGFNSKEQIFLQKVELQHVYCETDN